MESKFQTPIEVSDDESDSQKMEMMTTDDTEQAHAGKSGVDGDVSNAEKCGRTRAVQKRTRNFNRIQQSHYRTFRRCYSPPKFKKPQYARRTPFPCCKDVLKYARKFIIDSDKYYQILTDFRGEMEYINEHYLEEAQKFPNPLRTPQELANYDLLHTERCYEVSRIQVHAWDALFHAFPAVFKEWNKRFQAQYDHLFPLISPNGGCVIMATKFFPHADYRWDELKHFYMAQLPNPIKVLFQDLTATD